MKTITIPNVMQIKINEYDNNDIEIDSIEQLESLAPITLYTILETYNYVAKEWAYYNDYEVNKTTLLKFVQKNLAYQEDFQKYYDEIIEKDKVCSTQPFEHPGKWIVKQWLEENG